jgi:ADP-dependent NAD(P)H-hydrate dehydratase / NAD(P)H-hydrate epimerase
MNIYRTDQIRQLDAQTVEFEHITSIQLMNRAARALFHRIEKLLKPTDKILIMAGPGNNGGDALAVSRYLLEAGYSVKTVLCQPDPKVSRDTLEQLIDLQQTDGADIFTLDNPLMLNDLDNAYDFLIDGLFGTGLNRPMVGYFSKVVHWINKQQVFKIAIDLPSGLQGEDNQSTLAPNVVHANLTLGLQFPRLAFLMAENEVYVGNWELIDIGIRAEVIQKMTAPFSYTTLEELKPILKVRSLHAHKGTFGKVLLVAGSPEMTGAAILSLRGALRSGAGLVYLRIPAKAIPIIQSAVPEALVQSSETPIGDLAEFAAIAIGPGIGLHPAQMTYLKTILKLKPEFLVLDADALNLIAAHPDLLDVLPPNAILTPHPKEFDRLAGGPSTNGFDRLQKAIGFAKKKKVYIVLKGAHTACITPEGHCSFNSTGNPGMATGGSGDVLTGIIVSLLAQGYLLGDACRLGVFLHGLSGDIALGSQSYESLVAGDLAENLGLAFKQLEQI